MNAIGFTLRTPMVSWAVGGSSIVPTQRTPTWSAMVGLLGAALGIERDSQQLVQLAQDFALAVRVEREGIALEDYHTVQTPTASQARTRRVTTRRQELVEVDDLHTTITRREYLHDTCYQIFVVQVVPEACVSLASIIGALAHPAFPLYAGRRSCVVGYLAAHEVSPAELATATHWDERIPIDKAPAMVLERRDQLVGHRRFTVRKECIA